jgi:hypothetical protein
MKTRTHRMFTLAIVVAVAGTSYLLANSRVSAQGETQFKVGDPVETEILKTGTYPGSEKYAIWRKGRVVRLNNPEDRFGGYVIKLDKDGSEFYVRFIDKQWIRAPQGADANVIDDNKPGDRIEPNKTTTETNRSGLMRFLPKSGYQLAETTQPFSFAG